MSALFKPDCGSAPTMLSILTDNAGRAAVGPLAGRPVNGKIGGGAAVVIGAGGAVTGAAAPIGDEAVTACPPPPPHAATDAATRKEPSTCTGRRATPHHHWSDSAPQENTNGARVDRGSLSVWGSPRLGGDGQPMRSWLRN